MWSAVMKLTGICVFVFGPKAYVPAFILAPRLFQMRLEICRRFRVGHEQTFPRPENEHAR